MLAAVIVPIVLGAVLYVFLVTGRREKNLPPGKNIVGC
jgi:hypothetical protein